MFIDYYAILEIDYPSNQAEIKSTFRKQAKKWHPDINSDSQAHERMILLYEANLILSDKDAKSRYDKEFIRFKSSTQPKSEENESNEQGKKQAYQQEKNHSYEYSFEPADETLKIWMTNAKRQAKEFVKKSFEEAVGMTKDGITEGAKKTSQMFIGQIIIGIIALIIFALSKGCNS
jgi:DnaJ-class molecular chaperone